MKIDTFKFITVKVAEEEVELLNRIADLCTEIQEVMPRSEVKVVTGRATEDWFFSIDEIAAIRAFCKALRWGPRDPITIETAETAEEQTQ